MWSRLNRVTQTAVSPPEHSAGPAVLASLGHELSCQRPRRFRQPCARPACMAQDAAWYRRLCIHARSKPTDLVRCSIHADGRVLFGLSWQCRNNRIITTTTRAAMTEQAHSRRRIRRVASRSLWRSQSQQQEKIMRQQHQVRMHSRSFSVLCASFASSANLRTSQRQHELVRLHGRASNVG